MKAGKSPGPLRVVARAENDTGRNRSFHRQRSGALNISDLIRTPIYWVIVAVTVSFSALTFPQQGRVQLDLTSSAALFTESVI
jgi:hypothetical protein